MKPRQIVAALIPQKSFSVNTGSYLVFDHHKINKVTIPVGKVDEGHTPEFTLTKEMEEELGITVTKFKRLGSEIREIYNEPIEVVIFEVSNYDGTVYNAEPEKHSNFRYEELDSLPKEQISHGTLLAIKLKEMESFLY